jgi:uncharacterized protein YfcZ (UPF0381/DUF406 family)
MYSVKIGNLDETDEADEIFEFAYKNCKSIMGAKISHDTKILDRITYEVTYKIEIYFKNQAEAVMFELRYL